MKENFFLKAIKIKKILPAIFANLSSAFSEILLFAASSWLIVKSSTHPPLGSLSVGITLVRVAGISRAALRYFDRFFSHKTIFKFLDELREKIFLQVAETLPSKSGKFFEGELLHNLIVTADLRKDFLPKVILPISTAFFVSIFSSVLLENFFPAAIFFANLFLSNFFKAETADDSIYREKILDFYSGRDELKIFGENPAIKKLNSEAKKFSNARQKIFDRQINCETLLKIFNAIGIFYILLKISETSSQIEFAVWIFILLSVFEIYCQIFPAVQTYKKISAAENFEAKKIKSVSENKIEFEFEKKFAVKFENVNFSYDDKNFVFENFNLQIERGEKICLVGESGAGKTTLLYLMTKLFSPSSGKISVGGTICSATNENFVFGKSIKFNFEMLNGDISDAEILEVLKICQLENFDIDSEIGEDGNFLSGGERVRLQIALAISKNPEILILDEPTAGLDKIRGEKLIEKILEDSTKKSRALIIITHDKNISKKFSKVIEIKKI